MSRIRDEVIGKRNQKRNQENDLYGQERAARAMRSAALGVAALFLTAAGVQAQFGIQQVGAKSGAQGVTVTAGAGKTGSVTAVEVLTLGASGLEFAQDTGVSTCASYTFSPSNQTCTESVSFTPTVPGPRMGAVVLLDSGGNVLGTAYLSGTGSGGLGALAPGNLVPVAGNGNYLGPVMDGSAATAAELYLPSSVALDGAGNMYIADSAHNRIRMVCASSTSATIKGTTCAGGGIISTIAGNGNPSFTGDNGPAADATVNDPSGWHWMARAICILRTPAITGCA